ncbi:MAG: ubiquinol-cytochrome c reductase iron-sulfur subunit [Desulfobacterota bacterium]|nr:ubiquinol-cytochrome c reductase iron-sulfur subunit [Thermodesulfobacteriota bacterium]MDW8002431.1 ubiquinol-cytochrome c reductase iron-sulfur subunit [Deltaproteobacteria bacterium]
MRLEQSIITRRTFLNTLFSGWFVAFCLGSLYPLLKFIYPSLGREPDFVVLNAKDFLNIPNNSTKPFPWGAKLGLIFKKSDGTLYALKGVCTHMDCNITYKPELKKFYCACHKGWFDEDGKNIEGPPPKPLEFFDITIEDEKLIVAKKGVKVELPKS